MSIGLLAPLTEIKGYHLFKLILVPFIFIYYSSCHVEQNPQKIGINGDSGLETDIADLFSSVAYLPLAKSSNKFHKVDQLRTSKDWIYILTSHPEENQSEVMIFGRAEGRYFRSIKGGFSGPYDIKFISCIDIYQDRLYIMDPLQAKVFIYNDLGVRLTELSVSDEYRKFIVSDEHALILDSDEAPTPSGIRLLYFNTQTGQSMPLRQNGKVQNGMAWERFFRKSNTELCNKIKIDDNPVLAFYRIK